MGWKPLPIGVDNFKKIIEEGYFYVDKTLMIRDLLDMKGEVTLFTRPRRFGKTLNMSMLRYFFEKDPNENTGVNQRLFEGLKIMDEGDQYLFHMGKYPVITLSLKSMKQPTYALVFDMLKKALAEEYLRHWPAVKSSTSLTHTQLDRYIRIRDIKGNDSDYMDALKFLTECLYQCQGEKTVILIDEYDVPLENAWFAGFYDEIISVIRSLFESALKTNDHLAFAVVTGCLRISKESIFTGLNNLKVVSVTSSSYAEHFGFTQYEVDAMLRAYGLSQNQNAVKDWYDGYTFGSAQVYNPWSVINYADSCRVNKNVIPRPYWSNTSSNNIVRALIDQADLSLKQEIEALIEGKSIIKPIHEDITYSDMDSTEENLWNFLFFTGYLTKIREHQEEEMICMEMKIPNREVRYIYKTAVLRWFEAKTEKMELTPLYESMLSGDTKKMEEILSETLMETISFYDYQEGYYHGFLAGMLKNIGNYIVLSNRESGNGRPDIIVKYPSVRGKAIIIETKVSKTYDGLETKCDEALEQIETQKYDEALRREGYRDIVKYGVAFYRKECMVKVGKICTLDKKR